MARTTINTQVIPDGTIVSADLSYPLTDFSSTGIDDNATSNALTIDSSGNITVTGTVDGRDLATDGTKLDGIEASADVTDTANVTAAGALMDSEVTNLAQVKAFSSSDYATAAQGTTADSALQNIVEDITPQLGGDLASNGSDILFADSDKAIFGAGSDLQIYHNGSNSFIDDAGTGVLFVRGSQVKLQKYTGEDLASFVSDGAVTLYHNDSAKIATTATGIDVTGTVTADSATIDGAVAVTGSLTTNQDITISETIPRFVLDDTSATDYIGVIRQANSNLVLQSQGGTGTYGGIQFKRSNGTSDTSVLDIQPDGDVFFYADDGTTQAFFWDASAESLGIGTTSPANTLHIKNTTSSGAYINYDGQANTEFGLRIESNASGGNFESDFANGTTALLDLYANSATTSGGDLLVARTQSATPVLLVKANGDVGIGTDSPSSYSIDTGVGTVIADTSASAELTLASSTTGKGNVAFADGTSGDTRYRGLIQYDHTNDFMRFYSAGTERMRIDSSGNVGIGTDSIDSGVKIHVEESSASLTAATTSSVALFERAGNAGISIGTANTGECTIFFQDTDSATIGRVKYDHADDSLGFWANSLERMRIDSSGNVDISSGDLHVSALGSAFTLGPTLNNGSGDFGIKASTPQITLEPTADGQSSRIQFSNTSGTIWGSIFGFNDTEIMQFSADVFTFKTSSTERMRIDSSGRVGIGITTPSTASGNADNLVINENGNAGITIRTEAASGYTSVYFGDSASSTVGRIEYQHGGNDMLFYTSGQERMRISSTGGVGIGTTSPSKKLHVSASGSAAQILLESTSTDNGQMIFKNAAATTGFYVGLLGDTTGNALLYHGDQKSIQFWTNNTERMVLDSSGNLILKPGRRLYLESSSGFSPNFLEASNSLTIITNNTERMRIDGSGNVGIGTTNPSSVLTAVTSSNANNIQLRRNSTSVNDYAQLGFVVSTGTTAANGAEIRAIHTGLPFPGDTEMGFLTKGVGSINERVRITWNGQVVVGATFPGTAGYVTLTNAGTVVQKNAQFHNGNGSAGSTAPSIYSPVSGSLAISANSAERMRIDSSGNLFIGCTTTPSATVHGFAVNPAGVVRTSRNGTAAASHHIFYNDNGQVGDINTSGTATAYNVASDQRLKENIVDAPAGNIDDIRVRSFDWKADGSHQTYGMVAQELIDVAPQAVSQGETEDDMWGVDYSKLVPMMIKEIQDLKAEVAALKGA